MVNPRIFIEVISALRKYGVEFRVPDTLDDICFEDEILIVDGEGLSAVGGLKQIKKVCRDVLEVREPHMVNTTVLDIIFRNSKIVSIGIDVGKRIAYAVLVGGKLITYGYVNSMNEINKVISIFGNSNSPRTILLGIGAEHAELILGELPIILANEKVTAAYIVEESNTNKAITSELIGINTKNLTRDFRAAISIAVRAYERYLSAKHS